MIPHLPDERRFIPRRLLDGLRRGNVQQRVNVALELNVDVVVVYVDALDDELDILLFQLGLVQNIVEDIQRRLAIRFMRMTLLR